ncbi:MAG: response regulator [Gammaproteobacteria bacterium]|nr:response regulator [Gammaproteobacteria bacterium]
MASIKVLVVEDDSRLRSMLRRYLREHEMEVGDAADGDHMQRLLLRERFDCIVLDLMLPGRDGLALCRALRVEGNQIPVIMLTAKGALTDKITGLESGADDYLAKPFEPAELVARIRAVVRRLNVQAQLAADSGPMQVRLGDLLFDPVARRLMRGDSVISLGDREYALLSCFISHPRKPLSREHLAVAALGDRGRAALRSIDVYVHRLRRSIESDPRHPRYIQRVWGIGYVFIPDPS